MSEVGTERPVILQLGFTPLASEPRLTLLVREGVSDAFVVLLGYPVDRAYELDELPDEVPAIVQVVDCIQTVFGYPNDEAYERDPRGDLGGGIIEILGSGWESKINAGNQRSFGTNYTGRLGMKVLRHFFIGGHDDSVQFLGSNLYVDPLEIAYSDCVLEALRRMDTERGEFRPGTP